jgi:hypothetical protein
VDIGRLRSIHWAAPARRRPGDARRGSSWAGQVWPRDIDQTLGELKKPTSQAKVGHLRQETLTVQGKANPDETAADNFAEGHRPLRVLEGDFWPCQDA